MSYDTSGLPRRLSGKAFTCSAGDASSTPGLGRSPGGGHGSPLQYSCLENSIRQRSLAGYSSWGHKELDTTEQQTLYILELEKTEFRSTYQLGDLWLVT